MRMARLLPVALALLAVSLSGCLWWGAGMEHGRGYDAGDGDLSFPLAMLGVLLLVGFVILAANFASAPADRQAPPPPAPPPPAPRPGTEEPDAQDGSKAPAGKAASRSAKARRPQP